MLKKLLVFFWVLFFPALSAKTLPKINVPLQGNVFVLQNYVNGTVSHLGQLNQAAFWAAYQNTDQNFKALTNTLELKQIESADLLIDFDYNLKIIGTLNVWTVGSNDPVNIPGITLEINYDPSAQKTNRRMDYYAYSNAYKSEYIIESVTLTSHALQGIALYDAVSKIVELNFGIEQTAYSLPVFSTVPAFHKACVDNVTNELILSWTSVDFAEEYELEITFKDNYTDNINVPLPASAINYDFKENSTRIVTKQNYYRVPLVYERGYLLFRVRAVGIGGTNWDKRIPCSWSGAASGNVAQFPNKYGPFLSHVGDKMNWQLSTTYSDEGKRKDVVQYYDGLFMSRQTVTGVSQVKNMFTQNILDNSKPNKYKLDDFEVKQISGKVIEVEEHAKKLTLPSGDVGLKPGTGIAHAVLFPQLGCTFYGSEKIKEIIVQEVIYDFNGRPALQILPTPTGTHKITYIKKLNKNLAGNSYSWKDFDVFNECLLTAHPLSDAASGNALGAGVYYSPKNPNKLGYNAFIPDSKGYPFSRVQYTFDNTGRTYRQAGVGAVHTMDNLSVMPGHETKFYYAKPNQVELDRMFGNEVGYAIRYLKNMVVDPNGQVSVSYLNPEGKTIATALAGEKPDNLMALDNEANPEVTIHVDLLASNTPDSLEHSLTVNEQFTVASEAEYKFDYSVNGEKLSYNYCLNNNICLDCIYDLDIKLISNDSECMNLFSYSGTFGDLVNPDNPNQLNMDLSCINSSKNFDTLITLQAGSYTLVKTLKVNKFAAEEYVNLVFKDTCQSVLEEFLDEEINNIDTTGCYESCSTCQEENPDSLEKCAELCPEPMNECERARYMMLKDVSPGGQYAQYDITSTGYDASNYPLSIFNLNNALPNHPNWQTISGTNNLEDLILNWNDNTSPDLYIQFHPEYCMLDWCDTENYGADYDLQLGDAVTYQGAINSNLINVSSNEPIYKQIFDNDPFFHNAPNINTGIDFLNFLSHPCGETKTVDDFAKETAYCQSQPATQAIVSNIQNSSSNNAVYVDPAIPDCIIPAGFNDPTNAAYHAFGSDPATMDYEWQNLRNMYLTYKEKYLYESRKDYSIQNGCFNGCIGLENFYFYPTFNSLGSFNGSSYSAEGHIPINTSDPCGYTRVLYENKVKRFTNRYDAFSHTTTDNEIDLSGVNLYDPCAAEENFNLLQPQVGAIVSQYICPPDSEIGDPSNLDSLSNCSSNSITQLINAYLPALSNNPNVPISVSEPNIPIRFRNIQGGTFINAPDPCIKFYYAQGFYHISAENCGTYSSIYCEFKLPAELVNGIPKPIKEICCSETQFTTNADNYGYFNSEFIIRYTDGTTSTFPVISKCDWFDSCSTQPSEVESGNCSIDDFTLMLNQYLPLLTNTSPFYAVNNNLITPGLENLMYSMSGVQLLRIRLKYEITSHEFNITFDGADGNCIFKFPANTVNNNLKPLSGVCCGNIINEHEVRFTLQYTDGTSSEVAATVDCSLPECPEEGTELEFDSCATKTSFTNELFSFLSILKTQGTPLSGQYHNNGLSKQIDHIMDPFGPVNYSFDRKRCTLTFSPASVQPGSDRIKSNERITIEKPIQIKPDIIVDRVNLRPRGKIPAPCSITFSDCDWMSGDATLISIKPYFPNGISNIETNEFTITYCKGSRPDTLSVNGKSGCFPVNDCHIPYFCGNDTIPLSPPNDYNACVESKLLTATFIAYSNYEKWIDSLKNDLLSKYYAKCMKAVETFSYDYPDNQFHYTLYYYDQAGNLVRTVPPAGVNLLSTSDAAAIDSARVHHNLPPFLPVYPSHNLVTNYSYNSLNQNKWQITPDAGRTDFWYDKLGRIVASQNAKQLPINDYSYSWYDKLGRIVESGKIHLTGSLDANAVKNYDIWQNYLYGIPDRTEITYTQYDDNTLFNPAVSAKFGPDGQQNLRGRVASIYSFENKAKQSSGNYRHATHYTYDVTGNVPIVLQDYPSTPVGTKAIAYNFDLLTGKVNEVRYEPGLRDEFRHKYFYDDELRLTKVQTSTKGIVWETEAEYFYYKHGPLARTELGQLKVQGLDYIYTLQGWIKGVNGTTQDRTQDAGRDGIALNDPKQITTLINGQPVTAFVETDPNYNLTGSGYHSLHSPVAADAFGYVLGYYNDPGFPDYIPIDPSVSTTTQMDAASIGDVKPLYNGNISRMYTWLQGQDMGGLGMNYRYDQLNRIKIQQAFAIGNTGSQTLLGNDAYGMKLSYDPNGNIMNLDRNGRVTNPKMDKLGYNYYPGTNKLKYVNDAPGYSGNYPETGTVINGTVTDIESQNPGNYTYDQIGNLVKDNSEGINSIEWNLQNKITSIRKNDGTEIDFAYDALGSRVYKKYNSGSAVIETYYLRDASGNILSTYEMKDDTLRWNEQVLYGSSRLGVWHLGMIIETPGEGFTSTIDWQNIKPLTSPAVDDSTIRGNKQYELTNHLGNVLATISDRRIQTIPAADGTSGITADLISASDYYAFGMQMPGRNISSGNYRFGMNGQEKDNEIYGSGNSYTAEYWQYDTRLGRRWEIDPVVKTWESPYATFVNNPISFVDPLGLDKQDPNNNYDDNGDGVSGPGEGCRNTTGTWETHDAGGYTGKAAAPFNLPEVDTYSGPKVGKAPNMNPLRDFDLMREHMGDSNPYMFSNKELNDAANTQLSIVLSVIPVGQIFGLGKVAGFIVEGTTKSGIDFVSQLAANDLGDDINLTSVALSFFMQGNSFKQLAAKNLLSSSAQFSFNGHKIIGIDHREIGAVFYNTVLGTAFDVGFVKFSSFDTKINKQYTTRLRNLSSKPKYAAELLHYRNTMFYKQVLKSATSGSFPDFIKGVITNKMSKEIESK